ncbi:hypothetical protein MYCTH_2305210 [Thermothelomyces thermophilus ATCC 42464]|uniref:Uncharacterized protein n=1 Tax=Thermothelomyces thermophilus (strain ATCC 42464 / BCRC 31852 / DSM 1799) TaxID=573729 RepID=G2QC88_THET4|nr:uncharacterized protein MYCTH_2305210 [Thermothelomyces thermophilus ATCC 42464]AEO58117.1 hypothetical protein MYCTH_2305210 [Thermothelomyces thermophilus ATCC 42464]
MPTRGRSPAPSLPPVSDEATVPLSELFKSGFDPASFDSTPQLADGSILVAPDGTRYRIERISDPAPAGSRVPSSTSSTPVPPPRPPPAAAQPAGFYTLSVTGSGSPASIPPPQFHVHDPPETAPSWGRSPSNASSYSRSSGAYSTQSAYAGTAISGSSPTHEVAGMMAQLSIDNYFSAAPLYTESDGGVQAAETLTDPDVVRRLPTSPASLRSLSTSPRMSGTRHEQPSPHEESSWVAHNYPSPGAAPQYWTKVNYASYTTQTNAHLQSQRQRATATTGLPSLLDHATPVTPPQQASDPISAHSTPLPASPDKEVRNGQGIWNESSCRPLYVPVSASSPSFVPPQLTCVNPSSAEYDTVTPVVVYHQAHTTISDGASTGRDNVLPGEILLFDGPVKSAQTLTSPAFRDGVLKVFRNTLTNDLRFYCKVDRESETYWMKANNAQLVPAYAYDQRLPYVVYIRDKESDKGSGYMQASQGNCRPSGIYQFSSLKDLFDFQETLTGEKVVLDIGSVRMVTLSKANSRSSTQYSSARLQIWHEVEGRRTAQSDVASFVTAGTTLSGPLRERLVASSSRLMLYLGRTGEYVTCFSTFRFTERTMNQPLTRR